MCWRKYTRVMAATMRLHAGHVEWWSSHREMQFEWKACPQARVYMPCMPAKSTEEVCGCRHTRHCVSGCCCECECCCECCCEWDCDCDCDCE